MWSHRDLDSTRFSTAELIRWGFLRALGFGALVLQTACADLGINDDRRTTLWNADLQPESAYPGLSGQAAAVSQIDGTRVSILLLGADPGASFVWGLRLGTCETPGQQIGADTEYPELVVDSQGEATEDASLGIQLALEQSYHVDARVPAPDDSRVLCGDLSGELAP